MKERGFTLLEVMVATVIMGIAVVSLLSSISQTLRNEARLTDYDRVTILARTKMDELLLDYHLPRFTVVNGSFDSSEMGGAEAGWRARLTPFEMPPKPTPGDRILERLDLQIWWKTSDRTRTFDLEGFRVNTLTPEDMKQLAPQ